MILGAVRSHTSHTLKDAPASHKNMSAINNSESRTKDLQVSNIIKPVIMLSFNSPKT